MNLVTNINKSQENQPFWIDNKPEKLSADSNGDDVKGAFLALLQGLVGVSGINLSSINVTPDAKIAKQELKQEDQSSDLEKNDVKSKSDKNPLFKEHISNNKKSEVEDDQTNLLEVSENKNPDDVVVEDVKTEVVSATANKVEVEDNNQLNQEVVTETQVDQVAKEVEYADANVVKQVESSLNTNEIVKEVAKKSVKTETSQEVVEETDSNVNKDLSVNQNEYNNSNQGQLADAQQDGKLETSENESIASSQVVSKAKVKKVVDQKDLDFDNDDLSTIYDELKNYLSMEQSQDMVNRPASQNQKSDAASLDKMNSVKDALLARLMLGSEISTTAFGKIPVSDSKINLDSVVSIQSKTSGEKVVSEKSHVSPLTRRTVLSQEFVDKVKEVLQNAAVNKTNDTISVKVDPPHLGEIQVRIKHKNGELFAKLTPENKEVEQVLKTKVSELSQVIQAIGFHSKDIHIQIGNDTSVEYSFQGNVSYDFNENSNLNEWVNKNDSQSYTGMFHSDSGLNGSETRKDIVQDAGWVA